MRLPLPGSLAGFIESKSPFVCPIDYVMDMERGWAAPPDEAHEWGPQLEWRESSFFQVGRSVGRPVGPCERDEHAHSVAP